MDDTEPMPTVDPATQPPPREHLAIGPRLPDLRSSLVATSAALALSFVMWTQHEIATLHAEVREARSAAAAADRSAAEATLAARAAQSALASSQTQSDPDAQSPDAPDDNDSP